MDKTKNGQKIASLEAAEEVLVQCNSVDNQYEQKSEVLYTFTPNKSYDYLLNVDQGNFVFLKTHNTDLKEIIKTFTNQNCRPLEMDDKVNLTLNLNDTFIL